jgi:MFS transporter, ACS family, aldohexuronate transporter
VSVRAFSWPALERLRRDQARYRWYALAFTTFTQAASAALTFVIGPIAPLLQKEFGISRAQVGLLQSAVQVTSTGIGLLGGRAADVMGERLVLIVSGLITGASALVVPLVEPFWLLVLVALVLGLGTGIQNPAGSAAVMRWFPPLRRGLAMGIRQTGVPVGGVLASTVWPWAATVWGWRAAYVLGGVMALAGTALIAVGYFDPPEDRTLARAMIRPLRDLMVDRRLWLLSVTYNGQIVAQYATNVYFVLFLHEAMGFSIVLASGLLALISATAIFARIGWGLASDAWFGGARRPVLVIIIVLTLAGMLSAAALRPGAPLPVVAALAVLLGLATYSWTGIYGTFTIELAGRASAASAVAWVHVLGGLGSFGGAPLFGYLVDRTGSYSVAWLSVALVVLVGLGAAIAVRENPRSGI